MTIDWPAVWIKFVDACVWMLTHPAETAGTVTLLAGWFGFSKKLKEDAAMARAKLRFDRLQTVGELAYGKAAFNERKATGVKTNKLAAALEAADEFLRTLGEEPTAAEEQKLLVGMFTAKHEAETALAFIASPTTSPASPSTLHGC